MSFFNIKIICIKLKETYFHGVEYFYIYEKLDKSIFYLYYYICVMMKLGITEKDCCQDLGQNLLIILIINSVPRSATREYVS